MTNLARLPKSLSKEVGEMLVSIGLSCRPCPSQQKTDLDYSGLQLMEDQLKHPSKLKSRHSDTDGYPARAGLQHL